MKIVTIAGARPQFIKAAAISRAIRKHFSGRIEEIIVHSGQHYDDNMSRVFFEELEIPHPSHNLEVGSGAHGHQTGEIMKRTEQVLLTEKPDAVIVYGDTNTTLAGAVAAAKLLIPVVHIEAGLRSFNKSMPEEINRILCDHVSTLLFSPTRTGFQNLVREGFDPAAKPPYTSDNPGIYHCGDVMYDNALYYAEKAGRSSKILSNLSLENKKFILCTIHRDSNTDRTDRLNAIFNTLDEIARQHSIDVIIPLHPRTQKMLPADLNQDLLNRIHSNPFLRLTEPVSYFDMLVLESRCTMIITDSGGVQKESYFFKKPCLVLRSESEWKELTELGTTRIVDADKSLIINTYKEFIKNPPADFPPIFGDGHASEFIVGEIYHQDLWK
ncbi:MAG: UDP-N-acetylglucosamine 2-epimerase (non-hydrolyzing) [Bacteroidales bacterium]|nr:UDP-N-acetylglucosamine 2-epimerase (non-hydrolyzing) [Bacteroidales bacterium]